MQVVYAKELLPDVFTKSIFLAGPTPRSADVASWRPDALRLIQEAGYDGVVFVPEARDGNWKSGYEDQIEWEERCLNVADCILFWIPRNLANMPALTTNTEWGVWQNSGKVVFGAPLEVEKIRYQRYYANKLEVPSANSLHEAVQLALTMLGGGSSRSGGEREVPLYIWHTPHFQQWYRAQKCAGNRLDGARVEWTFRVGPKRKFVFFWALHVDVYIASENRHKTNEVVVARPDIATIVMYRKGETLDESDIVLIREFRSPAATDDGFVWEIPGGSSFKPTGNSATLAAHECQEETGLEINPNRVSRREVRQLTATLSAHKAHLFSVEITDEELGWLRNQQGIAHGVAEDTERTYVEVMKLGEIRNCNKVDWSMLGMILSVLA